MAAFNDWFFEYDMRDENEKQIFKAIGENDVEALKEILKNPVNCRLGSEDMPILSVAVLKGDCAMIKHLIDSGCDSRAVDKYGRSALHMLLWPPGGSSENEKRRLDIADILLATYSNPVEIVFLSEKNYSVTPFLFACQQGFDEIILRFLALIDTNSISIDHVIDHQGNNVFHYLVNNCQNCSMSTRLETLRVLIDKIPFSDQLINSKNKFRHTPLQKVLCGNKTYCREIIDLANFLLKHGASPDVKDRYGTTYFELAILGKNESLFETLLRAGCRTEFVDWSPLSHILKSTKRKSWSLSIRMIELLLAFGYDLQKELFLYSIDERPIEFTSPEYARLCDSSRMNPNVLEALKEIRRSNEMFCLQRECRNTIRRHLKGKADEVISNLVCIPDLIKSFLLVKSEKSLLKI